VEETRLDELPYELFARIYSRVGKLRKQCFRRITTGDVQIDKGPTGGKGDGSTQQAVCETGYLPACRTPLLVVLPW
jgi:hypothetical protein